MTKKKLHQETHINQSIIRQWEYKPHKNPIKNEKKKMRERTKNNLFVWEKQA